MLLIVTNKSDLASDYLILRLKELGIPFLRLNTEDYLTNYHIDIQFLDGRITSTICYSDGRYVDLGQISGVYFRQPIAPDLSSKVVHSDLDFAEREALEVLRSLWRSIDERLWVNHPKNLLLANNKFEQLKVAAKLGFTIPPTLISTNYRRIKDFYHYFNGDIIGKAVKHGFYKTANQVRVATTQKIDKSFIDKIDDFAQIPMIYQKRIEKRYDLRVTVIGEHIYTTALHSQEYEQTKLDWRLWDINHDVDLRHSRFDLPGTLSKLCMELTHHFNLKFSAIDMVYSTNNEYYFLEMNPNGQWAWIEAKVGFPIRDSIIECLGIKHS